MPSAKVLPILFCAAVMSLPSAFAGETHVEIQSPDPSKPGANVAGLPDPQPVPSPKPLTQWHIIPIPFYTPETQVGLALMFAFLFRFPEHLDARLSHNESAATGTVRSQFQLENRGEIFLKGEDWALAHSIMGKFWPDRYYGIGNSAVPEVYEGFERRSFEMQLDAGYRAFSRWYVGPMVDFRYIDPVPTRQEGILFEGQVAGSRPHWLLGVGGSLSWDSRDNNLNPAKGIFQETSYLFYPALGSGFTFSRLAFDIRGYIPILEGHVLALRFMSTLGFGNVPFTMMPYIGGDQRLRGIVETWVRDRDATFAVAEYRWNFWWRLGVTGFLGVGQARSSLLEYTLNGIHPAGGLGLRFLLLKDEMINLRVDLAYSDFQRLETYVSVGESF